MEVVRTLRNELAKLSQLIEDAKIKNQRIQNRMRLLRREVTEHLHFLEHTQHRQEKRRQQREKRDNAHDSATCP